MAYRPIPSVNSSRILPFFCAVFCLLSIFSGNCVGRTAGSADDQIIDIKTRYPDKSESLTRKECMHCHPDIARLLKTAGGKHTRVNCRECHLQVHVYVPGKTRYEDILPKCSRCHKPPHGEELLDCSGCHQEAHSPLYIPASSVLAQVCYVCHKKFDQEVKTFVTQHTELYCTGCHHTKHGDVPRCLECHQGHKGALPAAGSITPDPTPLGQCLTCHPPHKVLKVVYPDDTANTVCAYCHRKAYEMLDKNKTKHSTIKCIQCHPEKHRTIKRCKECHGVNHPKAMIQNFSTCGQCHGVAHSVYPYYSLRMVMAGRRCNVTSIGVSLQPYYSWVKNIVGATITVMPLMPPGSDSHTYQPLPADLANLQDLDIVVVNSLGHDEFVNTMLKAVDNKELVIIDTSRGLPLIPIFGHPSALEEDEGNKYFYNSHTYISITGSIQQIQMIARELGKLCPDNAVLYEENASAYAKRIQLMLSDALARLDEIDTNRLRIATVHDDYAYLFKELGIEVTAVVQPRHGIEPSAGQLQDTIKRIKRANVNILFTGIDYNKKDVDSIFQETGCRIYRLSHISNGEYTVDRFERGMQENLDDIVQALTEATGSSDEATGK